MWILSLLSENKNRIIPSAKIKSEKYQAVCSSLVNILEPVSDQNFKCLPSFESVAEKKIGKWNRLNRLLCIRHDCCYCVSRDTTTIVHTHTHTLRASTWTRRPNTTYICVRTYKHTHAHIHHGDSKHIMNEEKLPVWATPNTSKSCNVCSFVWFCASVYVSHIYDRLT